MGSLTSLEKYAKEKKVPIIQKEGLNFLLKIIEENNIKTILEIGTAIGYSAINMAKIDSNISVTTIERNNEMYLQAKQNIKDFKLEDRINLIYGDALFTEIEGEYDLIFIDAAKAQYIKFFEKYKKNLNKKGIIITDNLNFHGLAKNPEEIKSKNLKALVKKINLYKEFLKENKDYSTTFYEIGDGIAISKRKGE
ncbi:MAG: O-methyltransferase [Bacilli bacterium]|nr:O-methyltransferase [Bacilli bacterium]